LAAAECPQPDSPIETDRPDVSNSSIVVPWAVLAAGRTFEAKKVRAVTARIAINRNRRSAFIDPLNQPSLLLAPT
jgi:hypothetical protein